MAVESGQTILINGVEYLCNFSNETQAQFYPISGGGKLITVEVKK